MTLTEVERPYKERKTWKRFLKPCGPDQPLICVREKRESGYFEAVFALELAGVAHNSSRQEKSGKNTATTKDYQGPLMSGISVHQGLEFVYTGGIDAQGRQDLNCRILCRSTANSSDDAVSTAQQLWQNLSVFLWTVEKDYCFTPVISESFDEAEIEGNWIGTIEPSGIAINAAQKSIGFKKQNEFANSQSHVVIIPNNGDKTARNLDSVAVGLFRCNTPVKVVLSLTPIRLSTDELRKVASALQWMQNREAKMIRYHREIEGCVEDAEVIEQVLYNLKLWLKNPSGYRVNCMAISEEPIPLSFLTMVGGEVFHGCQLSLKVKNNESSEILHTDKPCDKIEADLLDLRDCINSTSALPPLFPKIETLVECGAKMFYTQSPHNVSSNGILLGHAGANNMNKDIRFSRADRSRHSYIIGATGTGKSTLLYNMIAQDIENDEGVAVIDPHGDLYQQVLRSIPKRRMKDVVLIDPCDFQHAVGINFLECNGPYKPVQMNYIVNNMIKIFDRLYDLRQTGGPIFEQYMRNALLLVIDNEFIGATLMDIPLVFEDKEYRRFLMKKCLNPLVKSFWSKQAEEADGDASLRNMTPYITSKLNQFTTNALLRPIIGQSKSTINLREVMDKGRILLVNLSKGLLGELDTQLLGMLIIGKIFNSAMSRVTLPTEHRRPMFLYVDEFQNFTTDTVAHLLSEARKFGLYLTLANQNLTQLSTNTGKQNILDSVLGNVGTTLMFRMGAMDAEKMQAYTQPELQAQDLQDLADFHVAGRLLTGNSPSRPFVFRTIPRLKITNRINITSAIHASRKKYTRPTNYVEEEIVQRRTFYKEIADKDIGTFAKKIAIAAGVERPTIE